MPKTYSIDREAYLSFKPSLAQHLGVESAVVLQRLEFLISLTGGKVIDGEKYIWCTFEEWQKTHFPFWSLSTVKRIFKSLEDAHILEFKQPDGYMSRKKYYRINEGAYQNLTLESVPIVSEWNDASSQIDTIDQLKLTPSITEQSSEQTTEGKPTVSCSVSPSIPKPSKPIRDLATLKMPHHGDGFRLAWNEWCGYRRRRRLTMDPSTLNRQLAKLPKDDEEMAIRWIENAMESGWQSIYPPKTNSHSNGHVIHIQPPRGC